MKSRSEVRSATASPHGTQHIGRVGFQLFEQCPRREDEHARIPQMPPVGCQSHRLVGVGLFDEFGDCIRALGVRQRRAHGDVAVAGLRGSGPHTEGDDPAGAGGYCGGGEISVERSGVGDCVVGGQQPKDGIRILLGNQYGGGRNRRGASCGRPARAEFVATIFRRPAVARLSGTGVPGWRRRSAPRSYHHGPAGPSPAARCVRRPRATTAWETIRAKQAKGACRSRRTI